MFIAAFWSPAGKGLAFWLSFLFCFIVFCHFPVWCSRSGVVLDLCLITYFYIGLRREKTCVRGFANNTGADQPAHPRRLISAFVIRFFESIISKLATSETSIF